MEDKGGVGQILLKTGTEKFFYERVFTLEKK